MKKITRQSKNNRCALVKDYLYQCLTSLFQEFLDVQFTNVFGENWIENILNLAKANEIQKTKFFKKEKNSLNELINKRNRYGFENMDKHCIDVTIANTLMLFTCYYVVSVPQTEVINDCLIDIISKHEKNQEEYDGLEVEKLRNKLIECIRDDAKLLLECQKKMSLYNRDKEKYDKNELIKEERFYQLVKNLVDNKNRFISHNSKVYDLNCAQGLIIEMFGNLRSFINFLDKYWEYPENTTYQDHFKYKTKNDFIKSYSKMIDDIDEIFNSEEDLTLSAIPCAFIDDMPAEESSEIDIKDNDKDLSEFLRCFSLLSNAKNHLSAYTALQAESKKSEEPYATIMLAFMYYCGWANGDHTPNEILLPLFMISDPSEWLQQGEKLKAQGFNEEKNDTELSMLHRTQALVYYIGCALIKNDIQYFATAGYLGVRVENFEVTKACFKFAEKSDKKIKVYNEVLNKMDESGFKKWAKKQNEK